MRQRSDEPLRATPGYLVAKAREMVDQELDEELIETLQWARTLALERYRRASARRLADQRGFTTHD